MMTKRLPMDLNKLLSYDAVSSNHLAKYGQTNALGLLLWSNCAIYSN